MDLSKVKVGDKVESCLRGWGKVIGINKDLFTVKFDPNYQANQYYKDGKY